TSVQVTAELWSQRRGPVFGEVVQQPITRINDVFYFLLKVLLRRWKVQRSLDLGPDLVLGQRVSFYGRGGTRALGQKNTVEFVGHLRRKRDPGYMASLGCGFPKQHPGARRELCGSKVECYPGMCL